MKGPRIYAAAAVCMMVLAVSCHDRDTNEPPLDDGTVSVKLHATYAGGGAKFRADAAPIADETLLSLQPGHIFFLTGDDLMILHHFGLDVEAGSRTITRADLLSGELVLDEILFEAKQCAIVSNDLAAKIGGAQGITGNLEGGFFTDVMAMTVNASDLNTAAGDASAVPIIGLALGTAVEGTTPDNGTPYELSFVVEMASGAARIQIAKISSEDYAYTDPSSAPQTVTIDGFTVDAIYVNNFYPQASLLGTYTMPIVNNGTATASYSTSGTAPYSASGPGYRLADEGIAAAAEGGSASPASGVWAYNVIPTPADTPESVPHIVIRFSRVDYTDSANGTPSFLENVYLTVSNIRHAAGEAVASFDPDNIYTFEEILFGYDDLDIAPENGTGAEASVVIYDWRDNPVGSDL